MSENTYEVELREVETLDKWIIRKNKTAKADQPKKAIYLKVSLWVLLIIDTVGEEKLRRYCAEMVNKPEVGG